MTSTFKQVLCYIARNPSMTQEQFYDHWKNKHAPLCVDWAHKYGIRGYMQIRAAGWVTPADSNGKPLTEAPVEYDGIALFEVTSEELFNQAFEDEHFLHHIRPDEDRMLDREAFGRGIIMTASGEGLKIITPKD
ncbi:hypothetical protein BT63DRAFT_461579 [Microthyrium microscopicum]|uniref:EthD domain-containing protein n=1 Tax=Microthyrium microscopicum TaxID=703497 RepID=A0A6A6TWG2_9PEZI|nr:hypothetical protein BT63DRAFT_461579 [Microthyrium microscopicum]